MVWIIKLIGRTLFVIVASPAVIWTDWDIGHSIRSARDFILHGLEAENVAAARDLQSYKQKIAALFGGVLPDDAWHLSWHDGLSPAQAADRHRELVFQTQSEQ